MSDIEVKKEIENTKASEEYAFELKKEIARLTGYCDAQEEILKNYANIIKEQSELINKLQGKENKFANNTQELQEYILKEIKNTTEEITEICKGTYISAIIKAHTEKLINIISKHFYEYKKRESITNAQSECTNEIKEC